jgi:hypothetical protein
MRSQKSKRKSQKSKVENQKAKMAARLSSHIFDFCALPFDF